MRRLAILLVFALVACNPPQQPGPPAEWTLIVDTNPKTPKVSINIRGGVDAGRAVYTNADGTAVLAGLTQGGFTVCANADFILEHCIGVTLLSNQTISIPIHLLPIPPSTCGVLTVDDLYIKCPSGDIFRWKGATWFRFLQQVANGEDTSYLAELRGMGFNVIRVLSTAVHLFDLSPEDGRNALPQALQLAKNNGFYVNIVAVVDSGDRDYDYEEHAEDIADTCLEFSNCIFEWGNEPYHGTQHEDFRNDMDKVDDLARQAVSGWPTNRVWIVGPSPSDEPDINGVVMKPTDGTAISRHLDRGRKYYQNIRRLRDLHAVYEVLHKPVVNNEPMGFAEVDGSVSGRQRWNNCNLAFTMGVLSRVFELSSTYHSEDGLRSVPLRPTQRQCAQDFIAGFDIIPMQDTALYMNTGWSNSPVASANFNNVVRVYTAFPHFVIAFGITGDPQIEMRDGFSLGGLLADRGEVKVWRLGR